MFRSFFGKLFSNYSFNKKCMFPVFLPICFPKRHENRRGLYFWQWQENKTFLTCLFPGPAPKKHHNNSSLSICCRRFSRDTPSKNISLKKKNYILVRVFFCRRFSRGQPFKNLSFKNIKLICFFFILFAATFPATSPPKNISCKKKCGAECTATSPPKNITNKTYIFSVFCHRFSRDQPSKKI